MCCFVGNIVDQVSQKSPPIPVQQNRPPVNVPIQNGASGTQNVRKSEDMLPQELTSMSENDLLSYINPSCFDQSGFLM